MEYYAAEIELNAKFHTFARNCSRVHVGQNTVQQQLKYKAKRGLPTFPCLVLNTVLPVLKYYYYGRFINPGIPDY